MFFPEQFTNPLSQSHWRQQKQKLINTLQGIVEGVSYEEENDKIDRTIASTMKIRNFMGKANEELKYDRDFEMNCIVLGKHSNKPVKESTVKEYFSLIRYFDKQKSNG